MISRCFRTLAAIAWAVQIVAYPEQHALKAGPHCDPITHGSRARARSQVLEERGARRKRRTAVRAGRRL
jgi:hypothetical protein